MFCVSSGWLAFTSGETVPSLWLRHRAPHPISGGGHLVFGSAKSFSIGRAERDMIGSIP